jgi:hypothetical protein
MSLWDNKDAESWDSSVPTDLQPAVKHLRNLFDKAHFNFGWTTRNLCFAQIHQTLQESEHREYIQALVQLKAYIPPNARKKFNDGIAQGTLPGIFKAFFDFYLEGLICQATLVFKELLEIGAAHEHRLAVSGVDWAESRARHLIRYHRHQIVRWVRDVCDEQPYDPTEEMDEQIYWRKWQAPRFLVMKPSRSQPYDSDRVWERSDPQTSSKLLEAFADDYVIRLEMAIDRDAGRARIEAAKTKPAAGPPQAESHSQNDHFTWKELEIRFRNLQVKTEGKRVSTDFIRTEWDSGSVKEEWILGGNAVWRAEFESLALISARKLGYLKGESANEYWLNFVREWMQQKGLDRDKSTAWLSTGTAFEGGVSGTTEGMCTDKIAELSAMLCVEMAARGTPESAVRPPSLDSDSQQGVSPIALEVGAHRKHDSFHTTPDGRLSASQDYCSVRFNGTEYTLTPSQSRMMQVLWEAWESGHPAVAKNRLAIAGRDSETSNVRDTWRGCDLWKTLIQRPRRGVYQLNLPHK